MIKRSVLHPVAVPGVALAVALGAGLGAALAPTAALSMEPVSLDKVVIIGDEEEARSLPGSGAVIDQEQMDLEVTTDINQVLKTVPGVYIQEEEGEGLRPNIGIRGATAERSEKITLMEDGVLIAPAPYSNPAAYYFPTAMRMSGIEVLKGAPLLRHGPQTTGGVVNMMSTPIPDEQGGEAVLRMDERGSGDIHLYYGGGEGAFQWMLETVQRNGNGFKDIDRSNRDTGFTLSDYVAKAGWKGDGQRLQLKVQASEEVSNETYLGLSDADFAADPNRRYGLSDIDQMDNEHNGANLRYSRDISDTVTATATLYRNAFRRDWFKLSGGGSYIDAANTGDATAQGILDGAIDETGLQYKHNNRAYVSQGAQLNADIAMGAHVLDAGMRLHEDEMDRFQPTEVYDQVNGSLVYQSTTQPVGSNNRIEDARAMSLWLVDDWQAGEALNVNLALRYENVESGRIQYSDAARTTVGSTRSNTTQEWLPGASFTYDLNPQWQVLAGYHKGFSPLGGGATETEEPETSNNWELGARFNRDSLFAEAIGFFSDFDNKAENCSVGSPCSNGATSGSYVTGEASIYGLEFQAGTVLGPGAFALPLDMAYTFTRAEISKDNAVTGYSAGDRLKDIPEQVLSLRAGLEHGSGWNNYAVAKYIGTSCVSVGCNTAADNFDETEVLFVIDLISRYTLAEGTETFLKVENVLDEQKIVARTPDGARPNKPLTVSLGMKYAF